MEFKLQMISKTSKSNKNKIHLKYKSRKPICLQNAVHDKEDGYF
jgi:hypothetical protein